MSFDWSNLPASGDADESSLRRAARTSAAPTIMAVVSFGILALACLFFFVAPGLFEFAPRLLLLTCAPLAVIAVVISLCGIVVGRNRRASVGGCVAATAIGAASLAGMIAWIMKPNATVAAVQVIQRAVTGEPKPKESVEIQVHLLAAKVEVPKPLELRPGAENGELSFCIRLRLSNETATRKVEYRSWSFGSARLTDNFGNTYQERVRLFDSVADQMTTHTLYPGKSIDDVLLFEVPIDKVASLTLELPGANIESDSPIRLRIEKADWSPGRSAWADAASAKEERNRTPQNSRDRFSDRAKDY